MQRTFKNTISCFYLLLCAMFIASPGFAETGVSDERVVLPDGPGSIGGVGENADIDPNMGTMSYAIKIDMPPGFSKATPSLSLSYSSGAGASVLGIGWNLSVPHIERMSLRGLPEYTADDEFAVNGGDELVEVGTDGTTRIFRSRYEKGFVRYKWFAPGDGSGGYWTAEYPDGRVSYFGADLAGNEVSTSRVSGTGGGVFRYHLVETVDPHGHRTGYTYTKHGDYALIDEIGYVYSGGDAPRFSVKFTYEDRQDVLSDCVPGFNLELTKRMSGIQVLSETTQVNRYALAYEDYETSGGFTRLSGVTQYGVDDELHPINYSFAYSRSLGGDCVGDCDEPYMVDMGTLPGGVDIRTGLATLLDINGDALPDVLSTTLEGYHSFYISEIDTEGKPGFTDTVVESSSTSGGSSFVLNAPGVQVLDVNGDGFTDIISSRAGTVLCNTGAGDWAGTDCLANSTLPQMDEDDDEGDANPLHVRFMDFDNDKRIDMIRTNYGSTEVYHNTGTAFEAHIVEEIGAIFDDSTLQLTDMNGDNLQDPVEILAGGQIRYKLSLGFGQWTDWSEITMDGIDDAALLNAKLEDINGDSLSDVVVVLANTVAFAINRNGETFDPFVTLTSADVNGDLPEKTSETSVLFADMNGNGSRDITWITSNGNVKFLELFPVKPNLLSRIENGIGSVQISEYGTSVVEQARDQDTDPWKYKLPHAMNIVLATDSWVTLTGGEDGEGLHKRTEYVYHDGFYDGEEKTFRGYARVEQNDLADSNLDSQEAGKVDYHYDVGDKDPYYNGLMLSKQVFGGETGSEYQIRLETTEYENCPVADVPQSGLRLDVRHICETAKQTVRQEGGPEDTWVTIRTERTYDGYGQVTKTSELGVIHFGPPESPSACPACDGSGNFGAPCGAQCEGDERYTETSYIQPGVDTADLWITGRPYRVSSYGKSDGPASETLTYYDGEAFEGLPSGKLTRGLVSAVTQKASDTADDIVYTARNAHDEHGNVIETIDPNGSVEKTTTNRRKYTMDDLGLKSVRVEILNEDKDGSAYQLRQDIGYEPLRLKPNESTGWILVRGSNVVSEIHKNQYHYDNFGRATKIVHPGDTEQAPSKQYSYVLGDPTSSITVLMRSTSGGPADLESVKCLDGLGREFQRRIKISDGVYRVSGFAEFNQRGEKVRLYQPYQSSSRECESSPPTGVLYLSSKYDAVRRLIRTTEPDEAIFGSASYSRRVYTPLVTYEYDNNDNDPTSVGFNTPVLRESDGLGRLVGLKRYTTDPDKGGQAAGIDIHYDTLGNLAGFTDEAGNKHIQTFDLMGRVLQINDGNSGVTTMKYDAAGNVIERTDARGDTVVSAYDGINRPLANWNLASPEDTRSEWTYDFATDCDKCTTGEGRLVRISYPLGGERGLGVDELGYDIRGRVKYSARTLEGNKFETYTELDNVSRIIGTTHPDGTEFRYKYDNSSRITSLDGILFDVAYNDRGFISDITYIEGSHSKRVHNDRMQVVSLLSENAEGAVVQGMEYTRDRQGYLTAINDVSSERENRPNWDATFTYDAWYRLVEAALSPGTDSSETLSYQYDLIDNLVSNTSSLGATSKAHVGDYTYSPDRPNAVLTAGEITYAYNAAGMMTARSDRSYAWDYQGRMTSTTEDEIVTGEYVYGPDHKRVMKLEDGGVIYYINKDYEVRDGIGTAYARLERKRVARSENADMMTTLYEDIAPIETSDGKITAADAWIAHAAAEEIVSVGPIAEVDIDRALKAAARRMLFEEGDDLVMFHHDHLGSLTLATNGYGQTVGERAFYPSGEVRFSSGYVDEYGFTGQTRDESSGLTHFEHRYLDTGVGRWASPDPLYVVLTGKNITRLGESTTAYAYVGNNIINVFDPTGLNGRKTKKDVQRNTAAFQKKVANQKAKLERMKFSSHKKAAVKFGQTLGKLSIQYNRETAGMIRRVTTTLKSGQSRTHYVIAGIMGGTLSSSAVPGPAAGDVASIHSHGGYVASYGLGNDWFSNTDYTGDINRNISGYVSTPNGQLLYHTTGAASSRVISSDMPYDAVHPSPVVRLEPPNGIFHARPKEDTQAEALKYVDPSRNSLLPLYAA